MLPPFERHQAALDIRHHVLRALKKLLFRLGRAVVPAAVTQGRRQLEVREALIEVEPVGAGQSSFRAVVVALINAALLENVRMGSQRQSTRFGNVLGGENRARHQAAVKVGQTEPLVPVFPGHPGVVLRRGPRVGQVFCQQSRLLMARLGNLRVRNRTLRRAGGGVDNVVDRFRVADEIELHGSPRRLPPAALNRTALTSSDIPQMTSNFVEIVPQSQRPGSGIPFDAIR